MSSLAGALLSPHHPHGALGSDPSASPKAEDADMEHIDDLKPSLAPPAHDDGKEEDDPEEMHDLFGEDEDVNMVEHECASPSVLHAYILKWPSCPKELRVLRYL